MTKSKISLFHKIGIFCFLFLVFYCGMTLINKKQFSHYNGTESIISGVIQKKQVDGEKITFQIKGKEKMLVTYYIKDLNEKKEIEDYQLGDIITVIGENTVPSENTNFQLWNYRNYLKSQKIYWLFKASNITLKEKNNKIIYSIKNAIYERISSFERVGPYMNTFILGNTKELETEPMESYQKNGVSHLLAISGMHISLLSGFLLWFLNKISKHKTRNTILIILLLFFYAFLADFSPSLLRAFFLFIGIFLKNKFHIPCKTEWILVIIGSFFLLYNPYYIYHIGFVFSFTISFFLILFGNLTKNKSKLISLFGISCISFLVSIPILIQNFYSINLLSPIVNLFFVPFVSSIVFPLSIITFFIRPLEPFLWFLLSIMETVSLFFSTISIEVIFAKMPLWLFFLYYIMIFLVLHKIKIKRYRYLLLVIIVLFLHANSNFFNPYDSITSLDVGQGDSTLIRLKHNQGVMLIDTGGIMNFEKEKWKENKSNYSLAKSIIIPYLKSIGISKIDVLVLSHGDWDHLGESYYLLENFKVKKLIMNEGNINESEQKVIDIALKRKIPYQLMSIGNLALGKENFYFLNDIDSDNENEDSLIIYTRISNKNIVLMGDAGEKSENFLLNAYNLPKMDIIKVGHHGSKTSSSFAYLEAINPAVGLISVGRNNRFNHPHQITLEHLESLSISYYMTSTSGSIEILLKKQIKIRTCLSSYANAF